MNIFNLSSLLIDDIMIISKYSKRNIRNLIDLEGLTVYNDFFNVLLLDRSRKK